MRGVPTKHCRLVSEYVAPLPAVCSVAVWVCWCASASAHEGPPYPIMLDEPIPHYDVSVWGDPDIGTGTFYVILEPAEPANRNARPKVDVWVQPVSGRLPKVTYPAKRQDIEDRLQYLAEPRFDRQEQWSVGIVVHQAGGKPNELVRAVEATPPGYGAWDLVIYLIPFLLFGGLWAIALLRRWRSSGAQSTRSIEIPR